MAILWNFHPYTRKVQDTRKVQALEPHSKSPFADLNGFRYHDNWLRNLLIASSLKWTGGLVNLPDLPDTNLVRTRDRRIAPKKHSSCKFFVYFWGVG